ncbi:putative component of NuA3 histone acetyltransferase complex [Coemansia sp. RSA 2131]|nr:putative component of NuA3 histone acetyltransferase complex [Coemansia sp. RSA 2131]
MPETKDSQSVPAVETKDKRAAPAAETKDKRARTLAPITSTFDASLFTNTDELATAFTQATPYPHTRIAPFCSDSLLRGVRNEMLNRLHYTQKETDIFKYHQSGDLANLDGLPAAEQAQLPCLRQLRDSLYSREFRDFVSRVTGCGPLSGSRTDMSTNRYMQGDHLLLHDDVIGDRRVSYIIYLPDPDAADACGWADEAGGGLELYAREPNSWAPAECPEKTIRPRWNQLVMFTVLPGQSHHAVQEVCGEGRERLSIQGWFHFPQPGEPGYSADQMQQLWTDGAESTLSQIAALHQRNHGTQETEFMPFPKCIEDTDIVSPEDCTELRRLMNPEYLSESVMSQVASRFADDSHIELAQFLKPQVASALQPLLTAADEHEKVGNGHMAAHGTRGAGWVIKGPPVVRRFACLQSAEDELGVQLMDIREMFASPAFARWLAAVSALALRGRRGTVRRFRAGLDYTLASPDAGSSCTTLDAVLCLAQGNTWADGVVGGYHCYVDSGDADDASNDGSVYRAAGDDGILLTTPASWNSLSLVMREPNVVRFVKYVSASAPGSRWDVSFEYCVDE